MLAWDHWHIEPSSICTLKCPRCPRTEVPESLLNKQLTLEFFKNQIGAEIVKQIKKITFCGNDGDPIYCKDFLDICSWIKSINPVINIVLVTNGNYKSADWWWCLAGILNEHDEIHWSIDGWDQESNKQYRVNCDWESIKLGIETFFTNNDLTYRVWDSIGFKFNQGHIDYQKQIAKELGFDHYQLTKSTKFESKYPDAYKDDHLEPTDTTLIASKFRYEREYTDLTNKLKPGDQVKQMFLQRAQDLINNKTYSGICLIGNKGVFLNSQGEFYPCCWTANRYEHNQDWHTKASTQFNLNTRKFQDIITDSFWTTEFLEFNSQECRSKCTPRRLTDKQHTTEW